MGRRLSQSVDLQSAQESLINKNDDPGFWLVDVRTDVSSHGNDSTSDVRRRTWCTGCDFKIDGRTATITSADNLNERNLRPKRFRAREVLTQH